MKKLIALTALCASLAASAQVSTTCTTNGNTTNCNSIDYGEQNRQAYEAGQQIGNAIGLLIARGIDAHRFHSAVKKQCATLGPGATWELHNFNYYGIYQDLDGVCPAQKKVRAQVVSPAQTMHSTQPMAPTQTVALDNVAGKDVAKMSDDDKVALFASRFVQHHPEYIACPENSNFMLIYMKAHVTNDIPTEADFEAALTALKPTGILKLRTSIKVDGAMNEEYPRGLQLLAPIPMR
jgi:hypothetical protein